jgi:hypothetical protein
MPTARVKTAAWVVLLLAVAGGLRLACISEPYFVDGPSHVQAIESGALVIQAPGYFLFNVTGLAVARALHCSVAHALTAVNILFGELGVLLFALLSLRRFTRGQALLLTLCYVVSPIVWFAADVHSTYAAMTAFAPLLFLCCEDWDAFVLGCFFWALMTGFRPSDGVFVVPWMVWQGWRRSWPVRVRGVLVAAPVLLAWWIPTVRRFGGLQGLLHSSRNQAAGLAQGVLTGHVSSHAAMEVVRTIVGLMLGWGLLLPAVGFALVRWARRSPEVLSALIWMLSGLLFFALYYVADPIYVAYFIAPGFIAAGYLLQRWTVRGRVGVYAASAVASVLFMLLAQPVAASGTSAAVANAYVLKFTRWSLKHRYAPRLAVLLGACGREGVVGECPAGP